MSKDYVNARFNVQDDGKDDVPVILKGRQRAIIACTYCRRRKIRCVGRLGQSCLNCEKRNIPCSYIPVHGDTAASGSSSSKD
ncbi:hypothetical protein K474DRAFT_1655072 [Panus rudis PR-1116 ss-1]|nr:hypothetical protein K474DRAFT_1655072 [Panus rudis PR-1116 ss-1]